MYSLVKHFWQLCHRPKSSRPERRKMDGERVAETSEVPHLESTRYQVWNVVMLERTFFANWGGIAARMGIVSFSPSFLSRILSTGAPARVMFLYAADSFFITLLE